LKILQEEATLVRQLKEKKTRDQAFRILLDKYKEPLYWHIRRIVLSHDDADDVLQNTFVKVFFNIEQFQNKSKLYSWIYRIATNESIDFIKKRSRMRGISNEEYISSVADKLVADPYFNEDETAYKLQNAIAQLPEKQRIVFNMRYYDEMSYADIAKILNKSEGALKSSYHHAYHKIKNYFNEEN
jgi:RNA polymerase sigma factor (sigma-70 family)